VGRGENGKLQGRLPAAAFRAGDIAVLAEHEVLERSLAILANIFIDGHGSIPPEKLYGVHVRVHKHGRQGADPPINQRDTTQRRGKSRMLAPAGSSGEEHRSKSHRFTKILL
jgi:hypothetical protein